MQDVQFLINLQRLLDGGQFSSTYKYALLMALADISVEEGADSGDRLLISVDQLADKFVRYYWRQVVPFPGNNPLVIFRQNNNPGEAEIVRQVRESREQYQTPSNMKMQDPDGWDHLLEAVGALSMICHYGDCKPSIMRD